MCHTLVERHAGVVNNAILRTTHTANVTTPVGVSGQSDKDASRPSCADVREYCQGTASRDLSNCRRFGVVLEQVSSCTRYNEEGSTQRLQKKKSQVK